MEKIKSYLKGREKDIWVILMILLVGFLGFGLGQVKIIEAEREEIEIIIPDSPFEGLEGGSGASGPGSNEDLNSANKGKYVGSINSDKYHLPWCSGAKRIGESNKIWFDSKEEAEKAGYIPAGNCPGI